MTPQPDALVLVHGTPIADETPAPANSESAGTPIAAPALPLVSEPAPVPAPQSVDMALPAQTLSLRVATRAVPNMVRSFSQSNLAAIPGADVKRPGDAPLAEATAKRAYLTARNQSGSPKAFIMYAMAPKFIAPQGSPEGGVRFGVYQASRMVAPATGSYTFALPSGKPLFWASLLGETHVVVVTGRKRQIPDVEGVELFTTDYTWLATHETMNRRCFMTMPKTDEPRFKTKEEARDRGASSDTGTPLEDGAICIQVANDFDTRHPDKPFVGIGGPDPYNPHNIIPLVTWDAQPGTLYVVRPTMNVWRLAQRLAKAGELIDPALLATAATVTFNIARPPREIFYSNQNTFFVASDDMEDLEDQALKETPVPRL